MTKMYVNVSVNVKDNTVYPVEVHLYQIVQIKDNGMYMSRQFSDICDSS